MPESYTSIKRSLRSKIFLRLTLLVGLTLIATSTFSVSISRSAIKKMSLADLLSSVEIQGREISQLIDAHRSHTRLLATDSSLSRALQQKGDMSTVRTHLLKQQNSIFALRSISLLTLQGTIVVATDSRLEGEDFSAREHFVRGKRGTFTGPLNVLLAKRTYAISTPVRSDEGELLGVLIAEYGLDVLYNTLSGIKQRWKTGEYLLLEPETHGGFCINPEESVFSVQGALSSPLASVIGEPPGLLERMRTQGDPSLLCSLAASGQEGILTIENEEGQRVLAAHKYLRDSGLGIIVKVEEAEVLRSIRFLVTVLIGTTYILLLLVIFIALRLSQDVVRPIEKLRQSLKHLDTGHWVHERSIFTGDELEVLDKEAARLADRLLEAYTSLERRVQERTQELAEEHAKDEALIESIAEGFLAIDLSGKILTANRSAKTNLRYEQEQLLNAHFSSILNLHTKEGKPLPRKEHFVQRALDEKETVNTLPTDTILCERKDGTRFPISITATPFLMGMEIRGVVVTFRDITEEKRIDRMKSEFISLASHQLRTPLTAIGWYIELMQNELSSLSGDQQDYVAQIMNSHRRMVDLVNSLLNASRIELGKLRIDPEETELETLVNTMVKELTPQMQEKHIRFSQRLPKKLPVFLDVNLVQTVLGNLLSNAVKYTLKEGSIELLVMTDQQELRFEVHDTGMGIPKEQQHRIFEKLFRADNVRKTDTEGTGIGLYIAREIVRAWGGKLWYQSEEGKGTTFSFTVPVKMKKIDPSANRDQKSS